MPRKVVKRKYVTVDTYGPLSELGGISGPIVNPCYINLDTIVRMINNRKRVYEVNPTNISEKIRLDLTNVKRDNYPMPQSNLNIKPNIAPDVLTEETLEKNKVLDTYDDNTSNVSAKKKNKKNQFDFQKK